MGIKRKLVSEIEARCLEVTPRNQGSAEATSV